MVIYGDNPQDIEEYNPIYPHIITILYGLYGDNHHIQPLQPYNL
jgi:hypothetical protein